MIRALLATTAAAALLVSAAAVAQDSSSSAMDSSMMSSEMMSSEMMSSEMPMDSSTMSSEMPMSADSMMSSESMMSTETLSPFDITAGYTQIDSDRLASRIVGQPVYDGTAAEANNLGNINDLVLSESGDVQAVIIGVGGFLGLGEKQVAVAYSALQWTVAADNTERFVLDTTVEQLTAAPDFTVTEDSPTDGAMDTTSSAM